MNTKSKIAITMGDPSGIGPEIVLKAINNLKEQLDNFILIGNKAVFNLASNKISLSLPENIEFIDIPCDFTKLRTGMPTEESGRASFLAVKKACELASQGEINAIVTAPISKQAINLAGFEFYGHTEILQEYLNKDNNQNTEMLFVANDFRVMLLTRHIQLSHIHKVVTADNVVSSVKTLYSSLKKDFNIEKPKIALCGLNPHAGEMGLLGKEEVEILIPAVQNLRNELKIGIEGPYPADTLFVNSGKAYLNNTKQPYDAYIACYHDQGLIPMKLLAMNSTVNVSINLPVIRTSPSHGTAFDIAGKGVANYESMINSIKLATELSSSNSYGSLNSFSAFSVVD